jgi:GTP1/Obg family GTP-binding protein
MTTRKTLTAFAVAAFVASPMAIAQGQERPPQEQQQQQQQPMPQEQEAPEVTDAQVEAFVDAYVAVNEVREEYTERLQNAEDQEKAQQLQQEANEAMTAAISDSGMEVEEYQEVAMAVNADAEVRDQVTEMLEERGAM